MKGAVLAARGSHAPTGPPPTHPPAPPSPPPQAFNNAASISPVPLSTILSNRGIMQQLTYYHIVKEVGGRGYRQLLPA